MAACTGEYPITLTISNLTMMMNTNTELPRNAKLLTVEEAVDLVNSSYRYYVNDDGFVKVQYSISPQPLHGTGFLVVGNEDSKCLITETELFNKAINNLCENVLAGNGGVAVTKP